MEGRLRGGLRPTFVILWLSDASLCVSLFPVDAGP